MIKNASVPESLLPTGMDPENAIKVKYKTNLLYPTLGPVVISTYLSAITRIVEDLAVTEILMEKINEFIRQYERQPVIPDQPDDPFYDNPYVTEPGRFENTFVRPVREQAVKAGLYGNLSSSIDMRKLFKDDNIQDLQPVMGRKNISRTMALESVKKKEYALLMAMTAPNHIIRDLYKKGLILSTEGKVGHDSILKARNITQKIMSCLVTRTLKRGVINKEKTVIDFLVECAVTHVDKITNKNYLSYYNSDMEFRRNLNIYVALKIKNNPNFNGSKVDIFGGDGISTSREWAYQRYETLILSILQPVLRGPVNASPVAPKSRLTLSEHESGTMLEQLGQLTSKGQKTISAQVAISSEAFSQSLDNLSEYGISDETAFSHESTLRSTLSEEKRTIIDAVAKQISNEVTAYSGTGRIISTSRNSEYQTEGKDGKLSTTELKFEVVAPVKAKILLDNIAVVWCPRVASPFMKLHAVINAYEAQQKNEYLAQSYVPVPVKPVIKCDTVMHTFEVQIDGSHNINTREFSRFFPFTDENTFIDIDGITATHRNGTSDDFNWDERWNWDDLEHAIARVENLGISQDGHLLTGTAVLETYDPELLNRSFVTIHVPQKTYTDETVAAMQAYENSLTEHSMKLNAMQTRASQYARMKRDELIETYQNTIELKKEAFRCLIRRIFIDSQPEYTSYYEEMISRCINWKESSITFESQPMDNLPYKQLAPDHFMNCPAIRFFLPVYKSAEDNFFEAIKAGGITYHDESAKQVREYLNNYRNMINDWKNNDKDKLVLDEFDTEIVTGHHLEAMMSTFDFSN